MVSGEGMRAGELGELGFGFVVGVGREDSGELKDSFVVGGGGGRGGRGVSSPVGGVLRVSL